MSKQDSLASCLAKMYESKFDHVTESGKPKGKTTGGSTNLDKKLNLLNEKVDKLLHFQEDVLGKLETVNHGMDMLEREIDKFASFHDTYHGSFLEKDFSQQAHGHGNGSEIIRLLKTVHDDSLIHQKKLDSLEKMVSTIDKVVAFMGSTFKHSKVVEFILKGVVPWRKETTVELCIKPLLWVNYRSESLAILTDSSSSALTTCNFRLHCGDVTRRLVLTAAAATATLSLLKLIFVQAKDKSEEKEIIKAKHAVSNRGAQSEVQRPSLADTINVTALEEHKEAFQNTQCGSNSSNLLCPKVLTQDRLAPVQTCKSFDKAQGPKQCVQKTSEEESRGAHSVADVPCNQTMSKSGSEQKEGQKSGITSGSLSSASKCPPEPVVTVTAPSVHMVAEVNHGSNTEELTVTRNGQSQDMAKHKGSSHNVRSEAIKMEKDQSPCQKNTKCLKSQESSEMTSLAPKKTSCTETKEKLEGVKKTDKEGQSVMYAVKEGDLVKKELCPHQTQEETKTSTLPVSTELGASSEDIIDDGPPPPAPFSHRIVSIKQAILSSSYTVCQNEVLGGGRFGQVHKCIEVSTGLRLAAKIIKVKGAKDRDEVKNEINVMNHLNHVNLIQLYDAFECKNDLTLIMEYLDGGELFDRITDENYNLTELDAIMFTKQICEGIYYLHQQYILHLDLKPENILCVSQTGNQIKIIDFGLARRYKPREKLKVNFGTPEFLAPEVVNYDFVSFPTDMWSIGVITYMLVSGLSPFLGESDAETMNYIVNCNWDFDSETFEEVSEEAKDFVSKLLVKEKSGRLSAGQCLKHEWLVNLPLKAKKYKVRLKSQILLQRYLMQKKWKKHFHVVAAANRLRKFQLLSLKPS
ncbi:myosin light chain kinase 3 isoform X1 [Bombina bombina]|uniref:myosin light chain kinase 3 isoform X1 n=1 Tax=Bombina bombina TaxID=8345 RepID=UPI00235AE374|nr:myosin light chain kinase 3 isoform X1 [Bombina bombina]